jgi:cell shape-determining protein MreD
MIPSFDEQVRWGLALPFFLATALLQAAFIPGFGMFGARADFVLIMATSWAVVRSPEEAMIAAPPAALIAGLLGAGPIGVPLLALITPMALALGIRDGNPNPRLPSLCLAMAISTVAALAEELTVQFLTGGHTIQLTGIGSVLIGATLLNTLLAAALYGPLCIGRKRKLARRARLSLS